MHACSQDAGKQFFADAPILGEADVGLGFGILPGLQPASGSQQSELGAVGVVLQGVAVQLCEAWPVAELPLGAGAFEQVFIIRYKVQGTGFKRGIFLMCLEEFGDLADG